MYDINTKQTSLHNPPLKSIKGEPYDYNEITCERGRFENNGNDNRNIIL